MRTLLLVTILIMLTAQTQRAQDAAEDAPVAVLNSKWTKARRTMENAGAPPNTPAQSALNRTNRSFERNRRVNDPPGTLDPNEGSIEARSAALDKNVQESRSPKTKIVDGFIYQTKIRNAGRKTIEVLFWEYEFTERANPSNVSSRQFLCGIKLKPDKEQELSVFTTFSPGDSISAGSLDEKAGSNFRERIIINRVEYADGTILQRREWDYKAVKSSLARVLETPWGTDACRIL